MHRCNFARVVHLQSFLLLSVILTRTNQIVRRRYLIRTSAVTTLLTITSNPASIIL